jgi:hypothetical protein
MAMTIAEQLAAVAAVERALDEPSGAYDVSVAAGRHPLDAIITGRPSSTFAAACISANRANPARQAALIRRYLGPAFAASCGDGSRVARDVAYDSIHGLDDEPVTSSFLDRFPEAKGIICM